MTIKLNLITLQKYTESSLCIYSFVDPDRTINGDYSEWSAWTQCSKTCSGGVRRRMRKCSNPPPSNGGRDCRNLGPSVESQDCNVKLCNGKNSVLRSATLRNTKL